MAARAGSRWYDRSPDRPGRCDRIDFHGRPPAASRVPGGPSVPSPLPFHPSTNRVVESHARSSHVDGLPRRASRANARATACLRRRGIQQGSCRRPAPASRRPRAGWHGRTTRPGRPVPGLSDPDSSARTEWVRPRYCEASCRSLDGARIVLSRRWLRKKPEIKSGVARMSTLEVQENQSSGVDEDVLGAEVAQDERSLVRRPVHRGDQGVDGGASVRMARAAVR